MDKILNFIFILLTFFMVYGFLSTVCSNYPILGYTLGIIYIFSALNFFFYIGKKED